MNNFVNRKTAGITAALVICVCFMTTYCRADIELTRIPASVESIKIGGGTQQYYFSIQNAYGVQDEDYNWIDANFKLYTHIKLKSGIEARFGMIYAATVGDDVFGSAYALGNLGVEYTGNNNSKFEPDEVYIKFNDLAGLPVDLTVGRQTIVVEKAFVVAEQDFSFDTNVYGDAATASPFAVDMDVDLSPVTLKLYGARVQTSDDMAKYLKADTVNIYGVNARYTFTEAAYVYLGVANYRSKTEAAFNNSDYSCYLGTDLTFGGFNFQAEGVIQRGEESISNVDRKAWAGMAFAKYTFARVPMMPFFELGGFAFSGDDPDTDENEAYNSMIIGFPDWGKWCPGEILGEQVFYGLSNYVTYSVQAGFSPLDSVVIRAQYFKTRWLDKNSVMGASSVSDRSAADEVNLFVEWFPNEHIYTGIMAGIAFPDTGLKDVYGDDKTSTQIMYFLSYSL